jgi:hypothetical protein
VVEDTRLGVPTGEVPVAEALGAAVVEATHLEVVAGASTRHFPIRSIQDRNTAAQVIDTLDQGDTMISANPTEWYIIFVFVNIRTQSILMITKNE